MDEKPLLLLIEDNESHALLVMRGLAQSNLVHSVVHVSDGETALDYLFRRGEYQDIRKSPRPKLILLDLRLPKIDGIDVLREIKQTDDLRLIPVVVLTSSMAEPDIYRAYFYGANSFMTKPLDFDEFRHLMLEMAQYWLKWNVYPL